MFKVSYLMVVLFLSSNSFADFIVKYKSGKIETSAVNPQELTALALNSSDDEIDYVEENTILRKTGFSNDTYYNNQWAMTSYLNSSFEEAKDLVENDGVRTVTVAVLDTGITAHSDISDVVIGGYDFISDSSTANDGGGRDSDYSDPGDACDGYSSSWHGTHVAGIIGAVSGNSKGIAGAGSGIEILPVRVLGACGGTTVDIADALMWAVGGSVSGVPTNPNPAKVVNMSLGGQASCSRYMQESIDYANSVGAVVVVSAGNSGVDIDDLSYTPANCKGVLRVADLNSSLSISSYSNRGDIVDIAAPGNSIYSLYNTGSDSPLYESYTSLSGTSMAAGFVSATAAMMFAVNDGIFNEQVRDIIVSSASSQFYCAYSDGCAGGAIDAYSAVDEAIYTTGDASFVYDDPVQVSGFASLGQTTSVTSSKGGGACGTVNFDNHENGEGLLSMLFLLAIFTAGNFFARRKSLVK